MTHRLPASALHCLSISALAWACTSAMADQQAITVLDAAGQPIASAAVSVIVKGARTTAQAGTAVDMVQKNRRFTPSVLPVQTGTAVNFPNLDTVRHHVYSFSPTRKFEIKLYAGTPAAPVVFDKAGTATLGCNIHDQMLGYIHVVDTPHFGVTGSDGQVNLDLPAGEHRVQIWWPALGESNPGVEQMIKTGGGQQAIMLRVKS